MTVMAFQWPKIQCWLYRHSLFIYARIMRY